MAKFVSSDYWCQVAFTSNTGPDEIGSASAARVQRECVPCPAVSRMRSHPHKKSPMRLLAPETPVGSVDYRTENFCSWLRNHQPSERNQIAFFLFLDLYWSSPKTGDLWYKSRQLKWTSCSPSAGWWGGAITCFLIAENHRALDIVHLALSPLRLNLCRDEDVGLRVQGVGFRVEG